MYVLFFRNLSYTFPSSPFLASTPRSIRAQLSAQDDALTPALLKEHKPQIDRIVRPPPSPSSSHLVAQSQHPPTQIKTLFEALAAPSSPPSAPPSPPSRPSSPSPPPRLSDAQLAQQLSDQLNPVSRSTRQSSSSKPKIKGKPKANKKTKDSVVALSQATIDSSDEDDQPGGSSKRKKSSGAKPKAKKVKREPTEEDGEEGGGTSKKGAGFQKPWGLSASLSALLGDQSQVSLRWIALI